ncbi:MAG: formyltransferase family protein [Euryarchaeota archaeon]|nr:formyltransferase family protein [Euryarchaeota archaeon]
MRLGWFSTGRDQAAIDLLNYVLDKDTEISFVFCNREKGEKKQSDEFIEFVEDTGIDLICFSSKRFLPGLRKNNRANWRERYDKKMLGMVPNSELVVLAGYMLILSPLACETLDMINLHPALPDGPKGTWQEVIWQLIEEEAEETGVMMHLVTKELDRGSVVSYCKFPIEYPELWADIEGRSIGELKKTGHPLFDKIREEELKREFPLIEYTIKAFADGEIEIKNKKLYSHGKPMEGYDITERVESET